MSRIAIIIPARYGSTRFPGKPLAEIAGQTMLSRVYDLAKKAAPKAGVYVTSDDERIENHCKEIGAPCIMTGSDIPTGSDRVLAAIKTLDKTPEFVVNLQGDAPFTPPEAIKALIKAYQANETLQVITPVHRLSWNELDDLRAHKKKAPFSGTTVIMNENDRALWFSKQIIPAIRDEDKRRQKDKRSPVYQHLGLYGYRTDILEKYCSLPPSVYEQLEGLEQLRMIENGILIQTVTIKSAEGAVQSGIDTPEDLRRAEDFLKKMRAA